MGHFKSATGYTGAGNTSGTCGQGFTPAHNSQGYAPPLRTRDVFALRALLRRVLSQTLSLAVRDVIPTSGGSHRGSPPMKRITSAPRMKNFLGPTLYAGRFPRLIAAVTVLGSQPSHEATSRALYVCLGSILMIVPLSAVRSRTRAKSGAQVPEENRGSHQSRY